MPKPPKEKMPCLALCSRKVQLFLFFCLAAMGSNAQASAYSLLIDSIEKGDKVAFDEHSGKIPLLSVFEKKDLLFKTASSVHIDILRALILHGCSINSRDYWGNALHRAQSAETAQELLNQGVSLEDCDTPKHLPPLETAIRKGHLTVAACIMKHAIEKGLFKPMSKRVLFAAITLYPALIEGNSLKYNEYNKPFYELLRSIVTFDPHLLLCVDDDGATPLHAAIKTKESLLIWTMATWCKQFSFSAVFTMADKNGMTPLLLAVAHSRRGHKDCMDSVVIILIEQGCSLLDRDRQGRTPLHLATFLEDHRGPRSDPDLIKQLLERGADVTLLDGKGCTPLHGAARSGSHLICQEILSPELGLPRREDRDYSRKKIMTILCSIRRVAGYSLPRDIMIKIILNDISLTRDLSVRFLDDFTRLRKRAPIVSIQNKSRWPLRVTYGYAGQRYDVIAAAGGEWILLLVRPSQLEELRVTAHGNYWFKSAYVLDLLALMRKELKVLPDADMDLIIGGEEGMIGQYRNPFFLLHGHIEDERAWPHTVTPRSSSLIDAFPLVKCAMRERAAVHASDFLEVPHEASFESIQEAYRRLVTIWQGEYYFDSKNCSFVEAVLKILETAYLRLTNPSANTKKAGIDDELSPVNLEVGFISKPVPVDITSMLTLRLLGRKIFTCDQIYQFFCAFALKFQMHLLTIRDNSGRIAQDLANKQLHTWFTHHACEEEMTKSVEAAVRERLALHYRSKSDL